MAPSPPAGKPQTIVALVDDDASSLVVPIREAVREAAEPGALLACYTDPREALRAFAIVRPSLVILDLNMPVLDGIGVLKAMKAERRLRRVPVIMLTAQTDWSRVTAA